MTTAGPLGRVDPGELRGARIALHWAALLAANVGRSLATRQPGFKHASLAWTEDRRALTGASMESVRGRVAAAVRFEPPSLSLVSAAGDSIADLALNGVHLIRAEAWLRAKLRVAGLDADRLTVRLPADAPERPPHDHLLANAAASAELARWFSFADGRLAAAAAHHRVPLPVPCWPDHFDLAVVVPVPGGLPAAQVTLGFSPGDRTIEEPYMYVTPYPLVPSRAAAVAAPAGGRWQLEGWIGFALPASSILPDASPTRLASNFLTHGFEIGRVLLLAA